MLTAWQDINIPRQQARWLELRGANFGAADLSPTGHIGAEYFGRDRGLVWKSNNEILVFHRMWTGEGPPSVG